MKYLNTVPFTQSKVDTGNTLELSTTLSSPKDVLKTVNRYLKGATTQHETAPTSLADSVLLLLQQVPVSRHAVLEYFCNLLDYVVGCYCLCIKSGAKLAGRFSWKYT